MLTYFKKKFFNLLKSENSINDLRIEEKKVIRQNIVELNIDGEKKRAPSGEILAATLLANKKINLNYSTKIREPRGFFCLMGSCQECLISVNGEMVLACQEVAREGIIIKTGIKK